MCSCQQTDDQLIPFLTTAANPGIPSPQCVKSEVKLTTSFVSVSDVFNWWAAQAGADQAGGTTPGAEGQRFHRRTEEFSFFVRPLTSLTA